MRAAIYARFSSENQKESSIEDQARNCERRAQQEGWEIVARYKDSAISGTVNGSGRPGYKQMLQDAEAKKFGVLLVDDLSRLSRDIEEAERIRKWFAFRQLRLVGVSDGVDTAHKGHKVLYHVKGMMNDLFLDDLRDKIHRGMTGGALRLNWQGGRVYGYKLVPELDPTRTDPYGQFVKVGTKLAVDPEQAVIVREIFQRYADGWSPFKIVDDLNHRQVTPPGAAYQWKTRSARKLGWCASALTGNPELGTGMLNQRLYHGEIIWNRTRCEKDPDTRRKKRFWRDQKEWVITPAPHLRIVDDATWNRVKARQAEIHEQSAKIRAALHENARIGRGPKYAFSGLLVCGQCGNKFVICDPHRYACSGWLYRGTAVCDNTIKVSRDEIEATLPQAIQEQLFPDRYFAVFQKEVSRLLAERRRTRTPDRARLQKDLEKVTKQIEHVVAAIADGADFPSLKAELKRLETDRTRLEEALQNRDRKEEKLADLLPNLKEKYRELVKTLIPATRRYADSVRTQLKQLLGGRIVLHPAADGRERYLVAEMTGDFGGLLRLAGGPKISLVAVEGIEPPTRGL